MAVAASPAQADPEVLSDLRTWLRAVDERQELVVVRGADWNLEIGALCELWGSDAQALLFDEIKGHPPGYRVLTNATNAPSRIALAFGLSPELSKIALIQALREQQRNPRLLPPRLVEKGPVLENVLIGPQADLTRFPAPFWHELDGGRFIGTADAVIQRDPDTGWVNAGAYRVQVHEPRVGTVVINSGKHGRLIMEKHWARGEACPVAVACGPHPLLFMLAGTQTPYQTGELDVMGGLRGEPVEIVETPIHKLPVPASSELVIEGEIPPDETRLEGPFGEWAGYYAGGAEGAATPQPIIRVQAILHRDDPILLGGMPGPLPSDNTYFLSVYRSAAVWDQLEAAGVAGVRGVWEHEAGGSYLFQVVSIKQLYAGHAKQAGMIAAFCLAGAYTKRFVVVVDEDIDPTDTHALLWALSTRVDPRTDIDIVDRCWTGPADTMLYPQGGGNTDVFNSRVIVDACRPWERRRTFPPVAAASPELKERILRDWKELLARKKSLA